MVRERPAKPLYKRLDEAMSGSDHAFSAPASDSDAAAHELRSAFTNLRMAAQLLQRRLEEPIARLERLQATSATLITQLARVETTLMRTLRDEVSRD